MLWSEGNRRSSGCSSLLVSSYCSNQKKGRWGGWGGEWKVRGVLNKGEHQRDGTATHKKKGLAEVMCHTMGSRGVFCRIKSVTNQDLFYYLCNFKWIVLVRIQNTEMINWLKLEIRLHKVFFYFELKLLRLYPATNPQQRQSPAGHPWNFHRGQTLAWFVVVPVRHSR